MKKKVLGLTIAGIVALSGVVSAANMWGTYKGNDIIRLTVDDRPILVPKGDVPAMSFQGRTMVPLNLLKYAGVNYTWDQAAKTVDIQSSSPEESLTPEQLTDIFRNIQSYRFFTTLSDQADLLSEVSQITRLSSTQAEYKVALEHANRIDIEYINMMLDGSQSNRIPEAYQYSQVVKYITKGKEYSLELDYENALQQFLKAKSLLNSIYPGLDKRTTNDLAPMVPIIFDDNYSLKH